MKINRAFLFLTQACGLNTDCANHIVKIGFTNSQYVLPTGIHTPINLTNKFRKLK